MKEIVIKVNGMVCTRCENRVKNALLALDGVESVNADHIKGEVSVKLNGDVDKLAIEEKIEDLGFDVIKED